MRWNEDNVARALRLGVDLDVDTDGFQEMFLNFGNRIP